MKRFLFTVIALSLILSAKAQYSDTGPRPLGTLIYTTVEHPPEFPGGIKQFYQYLAKTIRYPANAKEHNIQGKVLSINDYRIGWILKNIKIISGVSEDLDREALRVMKMCPKWKPGIQNGVPVRVLYTIPIGFELGG